MISAEKILELYYFYYAYYKNNLHFLYLGYSNEKKVKTNTVYAIIFAYSYFRGFGQVR